MKTLYGILKSSLLCYGMFLKDMQQIGCVLNHYGICADNKIVNEKHHALTWNVDNVKASHVDPKVNDQFAE